MAKDFLENLFDSIDLIFTNKLGDLNYDKTEQCTIQEVKGNNEYYVSNGAAKYVAYAQNDAQYKEGDSVYVTIPQGNYNNQKLIIGKHAATDTTATDWVSPMENFVNITGRINSPHRKVGLIANNPDEKIVHIWTDTRKEPYTGYDRLCLTADFSTAFKDLVIDGSYGIILTGEIEDARLETEIADLSKKWNEELTNLGSDASDEDKQKINDKYSNLLQKIKEKYQNIGITIDDNVQSFACLLDVKDMIGNPYDFGVPFMQEKLFEVEPTSKISKLALYFYQGPISDQTWNPNLITNNNNLYSEEENDYEKINFIYDNKNPQLSSNTRLRVDLWVVSSSFQ